MYFPSFVFIKVLSISFLSIFSYSLTFTLFITSLSPLRKQSISAFLIILIELPF